MLIRIIIGLGIVAAGTLMVWKPSFFLAFIGEQAWSEKLFGAGHGTTGYQAIGLVIIFIGFMVITGMIEGAILSIIGPLFGIKR